MLPAEDHSQEEEMRLDFNVLWLDDQPDRVLAQIESISRQMEEEAFRFNPTLCKTLNEVRSNLAADVFSDEVDLILVDWDLGADLEGQDAIAEIREHIPYKDVVFYSAQTLPDALRQRAYERGLEGIYCCSREGLIDEVIGVFDSLVKKVLDLDHSRGIVMGATSDIDYLVNQCLVSIFGSGDDDAKKKFLGEALDLVADSLAELESASKELREADDISTFFKYHGLFTSNHRLRILTRLLKISGIEEHKSVRAEVADYMQNVVPRRNDLGHALLVPDGKPQEMVTAVGGRISLEETRDLRRRILAFRERITKLQASLSSS